MELAFPVITILEDARQPTDTYSTELHNSRKP